MKSGIQLKESGIPLEMGIRNPRSTDKVPGIRNPWRGIQNPRIRPLQTLTWGGLLLMNFKHISDRWTDHVFTERQGGTI